jgi:hypothetical protein
MGFDRDTLRGELLRRLAWLLVPVGVAAIHSTYVAFAAWDDGLLHRSLYYVDPLAIQLVMAMDVGGDGYLDFLLFVGGAPWVLLSGIWPVARLVRFLSAPPNVCPRCRYDLGGIPGGGRKRCSECGLVQL